MFLMKVMNSAANRRLSSTAKNCRTGFAVSSNSLRSCRSNKAAKPTTDAPSFLVRVGAASTDFFVSLSEMLQFLGDVTLTFVKLVKMRARYRTADLLLIVQECGPQALPIVTLISFLVGADHGVRRRHSARKVRRRRSMSRTWSASPSCARWAP